MKIQTSPHLALYLRSLLIQNLLHYYPVASKVKMLLLRHLKNLPTDAEVIKLLEENDKYAKACGLSPLAIPDESQINRFKNWGITPLQLLAIFYFIVTIAITHGIIDSYISATDSSILDSHANPSKRHLIAHCAKCHYSSTCPHSEWVSADVNASYPYVANFLNSLWLNAYKISNPKGVVCPKLLYYHFIVSALDFFIKEYTYEL